MYMCVFVGAPLKYIAYNKFHVECVFVCVCV